MRHSEILGLRWRNVDLENNTFDVTEHLLFKVPPKTKVIEEMAPPKSNGRKLPITELVRPFFLKQFAMQEAQKKQASLYFQPSVSNKGGILTKTKKVNNIQQPRYATIYMGYANIGYFTHYKSYLTG